MEGKVHQFQTLLQLCPELPFWCRCPDPALMDYWWKCFGLCLLYVHSASSHHLFALLMPLGVRALAPQDAEDRNPAKAGESYPSSRGLSRVRYLSILSLKAILKFSDQFRSTGVGASVFTVLAVQVSASIIASDFGFPGLLRWDHCGSCALPPMLRPKDHLRIIVARWRLLRPECIAPNDQPAPLAMELSHVHDSRRRRWKVCCTILLGCMIWIAT